MISLHVGTEGFEEAARRLAVVAPIAFRLEMVRALTEIGVDLVGRMKTVSPRDTGVLANAHGFQVEKADLALIVFNRKKYSIYVHAGEQPNRRKMPPIDALVPWARRRIDNASLRSQRATHAATGLTGKPRISRTSERERQIRSLAFLVARAILRRKGFRPRPWFRETVERGRQRELELLSSGLRRAGLAITGQTGGLA